MTIVEEVRFPFIDQRFSSFYHATRKKQNALKSQKNTDMFLMQMLW